MPVPAPPTPLRPSERDALERLADHLTALAPLVNRLNVVAKQQLKDAQAAQDALEAAVAILRAFQRDR
jgi:hypothetical protein